MMWLILCCLLELVLGQRLCGANLTLSLTCVGYLLEMKNFCYGACDEQECCVVPSNGPWKLGLYRENFQITAFGNGQPTEVLPCYEQPLLFKRRTPLSSSNPVSIAEISPNTTNDVYVPLAFRRIMGYLEWHTGLVSVTLPPSRAIIPHMCGPEAIVKVGAGIEHFGAYIRVPFILQMREYNLSQSCVVALNTTLGLMVPPGQLHGSTPGIFAATATVRLWVKSKPTWMGSNTTESFVAMNELLVNQSTIVWDSLLNRSDPFAICDAPFAQCLSLPNGTEDFNMEGPDDLWVLSHPGTRDYLPTTSRAVDMMLGPITHVALLLQTTSLNLLGFSNGSLDLSKLPVVMVAVGLSEQNFVVKGNPTALRAFVGANSFAVLDGDMLPRLAYFSGHLPAGFLWPNMPNVTTLQITNPKFSYSDTWDWDASPRRHDAQCTRLMQAEVRLNATCSVVIMSNVSNTSNVNTTTVVPTQNSSQTNSSNSTNSSDIISVTLPPCPPNEFCMQQHAWPKLNNLIIMGVPFHLYPCFQTMPSLQQLSIDGSPMNTFELSKNISISVLRLTHNVNLLTANGFYNTTITRLLLYGNPKLALPTFGPQTPSIIEVDFSFSKMLKTNMIPTTVFENLKTFRCINCALKTFPKFSTFAPNVSYVNLFRNQISFELRKWVNTSEQREFFKHLCVLNMSDNAVYGPFPADYISLIAGGCSNGEEQHINFDHNLIEAYSSPPRWKRGTDSRVWSEKFEIFPATFIQDVVSKNSVPGNKQTVWLSLKNNRLKGNITSQLFLSSNLIDISLNNWWCDLSNPACTRYPIISIGVYYGEVIPSKFDETKSSPFWPYSMSSIEKQTIAISYYIPPTRSATDIAISRIFDLPVPQTAQGGWKLINGNITTVAIYKSVFDCKSDYATVNTFGFACRYVVDVLSNSAIPSPVFSASVWLIQACSYGRGLTPQGCQVCLKDKYSEWCGNCFTANKDINAARNGCSSCPSVTGGQTGSDIRTVTIDPAAVTLEQCVCAVTTYGQPASYIDDTPTVHCKRCDASMICYAVNVTDPDAQLGYFKDPITRQITLCDPFEACEKGTCKPGYNPLLKCASCVDGYYRVNRECKRCFDGAQYLLVFLAIFLIVALIALLRSSRAGLTKVFTLSITLSYLQIISVFIGFPVVWPDETIDMFQFLSFFNFNIDLVSPECAVKTSFYLKWLMKLLLPIFACALMATWYLMVRFIPRIQDPWVRFVTRASGFDRCLLKIMLGRNAKKLIKERVLTDQESGPVNYRQAEIDWEREHLGDRFIIAIVTLAIILYTSVVKISTQPFNCLHAFGQTRLHIRADPGVQCDDDTWWKWFPVAILFNLLYTIGIPLTFLVILLRAHRQDKMRDPRFLALYGGLVLPFREQFWFWELIQLARRLLTVLLIEFKADTSEIETWAQVSGVMVILLMFFILQEFVRPYEFTWCNRLEFAWTSMSLIILVAALVFSFYGVLTPTQSRYYSVFLLFALVVAFCITAYTLFLEKRRVLLRVGLGSADHTKVESDRLMLDTVFGPDLGESVFRKTRAMSPQMRDKFFSKVSALNQLNNVEMAQTPLLKPSGEIEVFGNPSMFPTDSDVTEKEKAPVASGQYSGYIDRSKTASPSAYSEDVYQNTYVEKGRSGSPQYSDDIYQSTDSSSQSVTPYAGYVEKDMSSAEKDKSGTPQYSDELYQSTDPTNRNVSPNAGYVGKDKSQYSGELYQNTGTSNQNAGYVEKDKLVDPLYSDELYQSTVPINQTVSVKSVEKTVS